VAEYCRRHASEVQDDFDGSDSALWGHMAVLTRLLQAVDTLAVLERTVEDMSLAPEPASAEPTGEAGPMPPGAPSRAGSLNKAAAHVQGQIEALLSPFLVPGCVETLRKRFQRKAWKQVRVADADGICGVVTPFVH